MADAALVLFFAQYGAWIVLAFSVFSTAIHGGQELVGWWGKRAWWLFLSAQASFIVLAVLGLVFGHHWLLWILVAAKVVDGIGFHLVFFPQWPGRETFLLPLADSAFIAIWLTT